MNVHKNKLEKVKKITKHLSTYMLLYTILAIIIGSFISYKYSPEFLSNYIPIIVFLMIYPMMVNVSFESLKKIKKYHKPVIVALFYNFIVAPILYYLLCTIFNAPFDITIALLLLAVAPASSMGLGYIGLAEADIVLGSIIVASAFLLALIVYPITIHFLNVNYHIVPFKTIIKNLIFLLILPLILGVITREILIERKNINFQEIKPIFSLTTMLFLYILIFTIFAVKGKIIITHPNKVLLIMPLAILFYSIMLFIEFIFNKYLFKLKYEEYQAIIFTTVSKNVALTIGLLTVVFGKFGHIIATYPAIVSIFQVTFLITYLHFSINKLKKTKS